MSKRKLIFLDVDGTVLSADGSVTDENRLALRQALKQGHLVAVTTGRSIRGAWPVIEALGLDSPGAYLLAYQGCVIYDCGQHQVLAADGMPGETAMELLEALEKAGIYAHTFSEEGILTLRECEELERYCELTPEYYRVVPDFSELRGKVVPKVIAMDFESDAKLLRFQKDFAARENGRLNSFFSSTCYLEYCKDGCNKGSGLLLLAKLLNWPLEDTIAIGDERNDIPMIQAAGVGAAMCNGREEVKKAADYVTQSDCNHSGVAEVIRKFALSDQLTGDLPS